MKKKIAIVGAAVVGLGIVAALGLIFLVDANQFRPQLEGMMGDALGRKVSIGKIRTALLSGGIALDDLSIADDPAFSRAPFVTAKSVSVGVDLMPLIMSRSLHVQSIRLDEPQVALISSPSGQWNFSSLGGTAAAGPASAPSASTAALSILIQKMAIANGRLVVSAGANDATSGRARTYDQVNLDVSDLSFTSPFPFRLTAATPGGGTVALDGHAGPFNTTDAADTPFDAAIDVAGVDVAASGLVDPASGLAGRVQFKGSLASDGKRLTSKGKVNATGVRLAATGTPARAPIDVEYAFDYHRKAQTGAIKQGDVHIGKAVAHLVGDYNTAGKVVAVRMKLTGSGMPATDLEGTLPALGIAMPTGASIKQGTVTVNLAISGPLDRLVIAGPINMANVRLSGFDLIDSLSALPTLGSMPKSGETAIQTLDATLRVAPDGIQANGLNVVATPIGTLTGGGTIAPQGDLNFKMMANTIPFLVQGTTARPIVKPDVSRAATDFLKNPDAAKSAASKLGGFFGKGR
jgi:AsmA protein